jgi:hypothetical protein
MSTYRRCYAFVLVALLLGLGLPTTAQAAPWLYSGEIIIHAFGNDTTTGATYPFNTYMNGPYPMGGFCNTVWPNTTSPWGTTCGPDTKTYVGAPLTGSGIAQVTGSAPATFSLAASDISIVTSGSFPYYFPYLYGLTYADLKNRAGQFFGGGGPGSFTFNYTIAKATVAHVTVKAGGNQFGGTMRLLGSFTDYESYYQAGGLWLGSFDWLFDNVGGTASFAHTAMSGTQASGYMDTAMAQLYHTVLMTWQTSTAIVSAFSWTTGTATVTAFGRGPIASAQRRQGYDNRTALGKGTIQLVAPGLTHWLSIINNYETEQIGIMRLEFVPEPENWMMLFAGVSLLGILYRVHRR